MEQRDPDAHTRPHTPQLASSYNREMQRSPQAEFVPHERQVPEEQIEFDGQTTPQPPQLFTSLPVATLRQMLEQTI